MYRTFNEREKKYVANTACVEPAQSIAWLLAVVVTVKGLWNIRPYDWPQDVPYKDPNNGEKVSKYEVLLVLIIKTCAHMAEWQKYFLCMASARSLLLCVIDRV